MEGITRLILPEAMALRNVIDKISPAYRSIPEPSFSKKQIFFDTFDWRLFNKGYLLFKEATEFHLSTLENEQRVAWSFWKAKTLPKFWWEFPPGPLKDKLPPILDVRALLPLLSIEKQTQSRCILNEDEKTVLRVHLEEMRVLNTEQKTALIKAIALEPVRGYKKEFSEFNKFLKELGLKQPSRNFFSLALKAVGREPGDYSSKLDIILSPELPARLAVKKILAHLWQIIKRNEAGIKADSDSEFLHDFRVAIRRTRSALSQLKGVFPGEITSRFKQNFATLGKSTNQMRDLDIYLLKKKQYRAMLPEQLRSGLEPLFQSMAAERKGEFNKLVKALDDTPYQETISSWGIFLNQAEESGREGAKNSHKPVLALAQKFIFKKHKQVINFGGEIDDAAPDVELHRLRIECKKLRYLLEFFASLFPEKEMAILIKQLKKLQDNLGDFNDLSVQQEKLKAYSENLVPTNREYWKIVTAVGGLMAILFQRQQNVRRAFSQRFDDFSRQENIALFHQLFSV